MCSGRRGEPNAHALLVLALEGEPVGKALRVEMVLLPEKAPAERCVLGGEDSVIVRCAIAFLPSTQLTMQKNGGGG